MDDIIDLAARRAAKQKVAEAPHQIDDSVLEGYRIAWSQDGRVMVVFVTDDQEYTAVLDRAAARRFAKRVEIAAERARRCLASTSSGK